MTRPVNLLIGTTGSVAAIKVPEIIERFQSAGNTWKGKGDPVIHIDLRKWADILVVVPLDANTLAKVANGLCDNLLTCVLRAWDFTKPCVVCPAMNTHMWDHPFTGKHLRVLVDELHFRVIPPISKLLACGDLGIGAMAEPVDIMAKVTEIIRELDLTGDAL
ncbi:putative phosphopantothenoylcysteine decarboxylase [Tieghemiomyces parasiticus]|uniref:Phosphopantothenoylcysteine decarboxylase n=1 Tax=Tieghemiomyces parasiticus TaxID=78921 RepID=A0A9W7ZRP7_9FUNG|nr:putative phosphopantothenoylcysteine decarboxylase [Tieghemiomyces parasiticus]